MASEYLKWKYRDVRPEKQTSMTPRERRRNWWDYHKWHVAAGAVGLFVLVRIVLTMLGVGKAEPDYQIAYVGAYALPQSTAEAVEQAVAAMAEDCNGDGQVVVSLRQYATGSELQPEAAMAAITALVADISECESYIFLLEDPEDFQRDFQLLAPLRGAPAPDGTDPWEDCCLSWSACPALAGLDLGTYEELAVDQTVTGRHQDLLAGLYLARRGFWAEKNVAYPEASAQLWAALTQGAGA
ncbi:MAG: hypothetical protein HFF17_07370 [Oscillospiraceae bacterium]|nr:hypothetical protein [Oscillospiraceae bacterium]